jgi:hypothetical protein
MKKAILLISLSSVLFSCKNLKDEKIEIGLKDEKISIRYEGLERLSGGFPILENSSAIIKDAKAHDNSVTFNTNRKPIEIKATTDTSGIVCLSLVANGNESRKGLDFIGLFFKNIPKFKQGVSIWRYKPWNSWSKPVHIDSISQIESWDVQFFYWQYKDGLYGAAMPLCGNGYRTTLGSEKGCFGAKSVSYIDNYKAGSVPQMAVGFGTDPYKLFQGLYEAGLKAMNVTENLKKNKKYPEILEGIGWCTWNSSNYGHDQTDKHILEGGKYFYENKFPVNWIIIDDGWYNSTNSMMNSYYPSKSKFPKGFKPAVDELKSKYGIKNVGLWHAFAGHWNGINPYSGLGIRFKSELFSWTQKEHPDQEISKLLTFNFIKPGSKALDQYYNEFHNYLKDQGITFLKVDNQLVAERMCVNNYPIFDLSKKMHEALYKSVFEKFNGTIINCMDMTSEAYLNFGKSAVARSEEDYFEYDPTENYNLQKGNAAAHVLQAVYNSLYFSQMVYTDFDMFQSHNPNATFHAIARALSGGPIYITDRLGQSKFDLLWPLIYSDGKILRSENPLLPTEDCLFQVQDKKLFKAYSSTKGIGLVVVYNCADTDKVEGSFKPSDVQKIAGSNFGVYEHFSKQLMIADAGKEFSVSLNRMGYKLYYIVPLTGGNAAIGLVNKYNAPASLLEVSNTSTKVSATLYEGGTFAAIVISQPKKVKVNGAIAEYSYTNNLLTIEIPVKEKNCKVEIEF